MKPARRWVIVVCFVLLALESQLAACHSAHNHSHTRLVLEQQQQQQENNNNNQEEGDNNNSNKQKEREQQMQEHIKIVWTGTRFVAAFLILINLVMVYALGLFFVLHRHMDDRHKGPSGCTSPFECIAIPVTTAALHIAMVAYYALVLYPSNDTDDNGNKFRYVSQYRILGITGIVFLVLEHWFTVYWLVFQKADRPAGMVLSVLLPCLLLFLFVLQACVAAMSGEWYPFLRGVDGSISSSMDYLTGQITAVYGLALLTGLFPFSETQQIYTNNTWLRGFRILLTMIAGIGLFLVALSPINNDKAVGTVSETQKEIWAGQHFIIAGISFGALFVYYVVATVDHALHGEVGSGFGTYLGLGIACLGFVTWVITLIINFIKPTDLSHLLFASGEYTLIAAAPFVSAMRFSLVDFQANREAMINVYEDGQPTGG